ncbi:MAG: hypothetical protein GY929_21775 [Actinomycetia bacterium]|nr:hypothetical protein [Actinomycetes bacterium]
MSRRRKQDHPKPQHGNTNRRCQSQSPAPLDEPITIRGIGEALETSMGLDHDFDQYRAGFVLDHLGYLVGAIILTEAHDTIDDVIEVVEREVLQHPDPALFVVLFSSGLEILDDTDPQAELRLFEFRDRLAPHVEVVDWLMSGHDHFRSVVSMTDDPSLGWDQQGRLPHRAPRGTA